MCKWKILECQMYWTVVCQLSWSWCFKWILSKTIIWFTTIFSVLGWYILYFWNKKKTVFKMPETICASIAIRRKWNPFIDYEKRATELKKLNSHPCSEPVSLNVILYISYQLKHVGTLKYQNFQKSFEIIFKIIPISIMWKLRLKALIMFYTKSWKN